MVSKLDATKAVLTEIQVWILILCLIVSCIRAILRTMFVIYTETPMGVPLIVASLMSFAFLIRVKIMGGCAGSFFYLLTELVFVTFYWILSFYAFDTNELC